MDNFLKEFLNLYWIRPESALLTALLAKNMPNDYLKDYKNTADINCGDGIFSFILNGGKLDSSFNLYDNTKISSNIVKKEDIYNYFDKTYNPKVITDSNYKYSYGIDINENMLYKSKALNIYNSQLLYTGDKYLINTEGYPLKNISDNSNVSLYNKLDLITIFSSIYMYKDTSLILKKVNSLLSESGTFIVNTKTNSFYDFYKNLEENYPKKFSTYIERDMRNILTSLHKESKWETLFATHGFEIIEKRPTFSNKMTPLWTVGLRFLTPLLIKLSNSIENKNTFYEIKADFVETFYKVFEDFYEEDIKDDASSFLYILRKK